MIHQTVASSQWIHLKDDTQFNVRVLVFMVGLCDYDRQCWEDEKLNRMSDALELFQRTMDSWETWHIHSVELVLSKRDVFAAQLPVSPITQCPELAAYPGPPDDVEAATAFIREQFLARAGPFSSVVRVHVINALDSDEVQLLWKLVTRTLCHIRTDDFITLTR